MIYYLHDDPAECAKMLDDKTLSKQIKAIAQVLCGAYFNANFGKEFIPDRLVILRVQNEFTRWASECRANYLNLVERGCEALKEYIYRFTRDIFKPEKEHEFHHVIEWCAVNVPDLPVNKIAMEQVGCDETTEFPLVMPGQYIEYLSYTVRQGSPKPVCVVQSYRNYYRAKIAKFYKRCEEQHDCCLYANKDKYCIKQNLPTWSRRTKPAYLILEEIK